MIISPSILTANFLNLSSELDKVKDHVKWLHLDIMDGNFVPNLSFGPAVVSCLRKGSDLFFDTHLMIKDPLSYIDAFSTAGADLICFHIESDSDTSKTIEKIKSLNKKTGLAISPDTDIKEVFPYLDKLDMVLVMSVYPGFGGQKFIPNTTNKIKELTSHLKDINHTDLLIQVDGGINADTAKLVTDAGANVLVAGSYIFDSNNPQVAIRSLLS